MRQLLRRKLFAAAAIGSLALGIGLTTTLFSVVNAVLFKGGPVETPEQLLEIYSGVSNDFPQLTTSYPDFVDIQRGTPALDQVAANAYVRAILSMPDRGVLVTGEAVTANYFDVLRVRVRHGRAFHNDEDRVPDQAPVVVLGHGLWQQRFGSRESILGETLRLSGHRYTVIGIAPARFTGTLPGIPTEFWVPVTMVERLEFSGVQWSTDENPGATRLDRRGTRWLFVKGRIRAGHTVADARAQIDTIFARLSAEYPATNKTVTPSVVPAVSIRFHPMLDGYLRAGGAVLLGAVGLVLLIACANVANMLMARSAARRREMALRTAVGASRLHLLRQLLTEAMVLSGIGGGLGIFMAWWAARALSGFGSNVFPMPISFDFSPDLQVLTFAVGVSVATAALFGLAPAWTSSKPDLVPALKASAEGDSRRRFSLKDALVAGQLALSLVLLVSGALLTRGVLSARATDLGYDPTFLSSLSFNLQMNGYDLERATAFRDRALQTLSALPGVRSVSTASRLPLAPDINMDGIHVPGVHNPGDEGTPVDVVAVGAEYFATVGVPIVAGRAFTADDIVQDRRVAIVNKAMARQFWPTADPVGQRLYRAGFDSEPFEIVGIARDHKVRSVGEAPRPYLHVPSGKSRAIGLIVRTSTLPAAALPMLREALWALEPDIVFTEDVPAASIADTSLAPTTLGAQVLGAFGALALLLAAVGVYGVVAYTVSRRTREIGIRLALGAGRGQVLRLVLAQGTRLALVGIGLGALASAGAGQVLESLLYGVSGVDPVAYSVAAVLLLAVTVLANLIPALMAARIEPVRALGSE